MLLILMEPISVLCWPGTEVRGISDPAGTLTDPAAPTRDPADLCKMVPNNKWEKNRDHPALGSHFCH